MGKPLCAYQHCFFVSFESSVASCQSVYTRHQHNVFEQHVMITQHLLQTYIDAENKCQLRSLGMQMLCCIAHIASFICSRISCSFLTNSLRIPVLACPQCSGSFGSPLSKRKHNPLASSRTSSSHHCHPHSRQIKELLRDAKKECCASVYNKSTCLLAYICAQN